MSSRCEAGSPTPHCRGFRRRPHGGRLQRRRTRRRRVTARCGHHAPRTRDYLGAVEGRGWCRTRCLPDGGLRRWEARRELTGGAPRHTSRLARNGYSPDVDPVHATSQACSPGPPLNTRALTMTDLTTTAVLDMTKAPVFHVKHRGLRRDGQALGARTASISSWRARLGRAPITDFTSSPPE